VQGSPFCGANLPCFRLVEDAAARFRLPTQQFLPSAATLACRNLACVSDEQDTIITLAMQEAEIFLRDLGFDISSQDLAASTSGENVYFDCARIVYV
jgi:hypothetical protein